MTRADVIEYLAERGLSHTNDSSNSDIRFLRNRIRRLLVPFLDREFPHWRAPLLSLNKTQALAADFLGAETARRLPWNREGENLFLDETAFFAQSPIIREEALFQALDILCRASGDFRPRRAAISPFAAGEKSAQDLGLFRLEKKNGRITAGPRPVARKAFSVLIKNPGVYKLEKLTLRFSTDTTMGGRGVFASFPLIVRSLERNENPAVEVRDRNGRAAIIGFQGKIVWARKGGSRNGSVVLEIAAQQPLGE
jgi:tRNA(Ile)-lysidine synthase